MKPWIQYALAFLLLVHGFIYVRVGSMLPDPIKVFWDGQTSLLVEEGALGALISLAVLVGAIFLPLAFR
jgi:hypothetical protein